METEFKPLFNMNTSAENVRIGGVIRKALREKLKRRGLVIGLSGGIDSSTCTALAASALGSDKVFALLMPEKDSNPDTLRISQLVAETFGIDFIYEDISPILESLGCYRRQAEAVRRVLPEFCDDWKFKIVLPPVNGGFRLFSVVVERPDGSLVKKRLPHQAYLEIVAATNFKQRVRKTLEYYHADRLNYAVVGTPNFQEYDQGFFVKNGDGSADIKPIAHLYKIQVYSMAKYLGVPEDILKRPPTTDTYSLSQGQDEFYFSLPYKEMDICLFGLNNKIPDDIVCKEAGIDPKTLGAVYSDIEQKRLTSEYLHSRPILMTDIL